MLFPSTTLISIWLALGQTALGASHIHPPPGAFVVRSASPATKEFSTVSDAVNALPNDKSAQIIFIYPGTYTEQVYIARPGRLTIFGYTTDSTSYLSNTVTIQFALSAATAGSDDASGTLRIHKDNFKMYNVNVKNTFGIGSQAIAISQYGNRVGLYGCAFFGYQDTVLAEQGAQVFLKGYIEGAVDFIFGQRGKAYFGGNTIAVKGPGHVTASGRSSDDDTSYVFNKNRIVLTSDAPPETAGNVFLGRPWSDFAKVIFKNTKITAPLNKTLWSKWYADSPQTGHIFFAHFNVTGHGISGASSAGFSVELTSNQAAAFTIASAVGADYREWVDAKYIV